jgi:hypothetical protein
MNTALPREQRDSGLVEALRGGLSGLDCTRIAELLNRDCQCVSLDRERLRRELLKDPSGAELVAMIEERSYLFSDSVVFVAEAWLRRMERIIAAVETVVALPAYQQRVLAYAPEMARFVPKARGVFLGYDFHQGAQGPQIIEVNTNAGGALLNGVLGRAQQACCESVAVMLPGLWADHGLEQTLFEMFLEEWRLERGDAPLSYAVIADEQPRAQYLYPEFVLFKKLFESGGVAAAIVEPVELVWRDGALWHGGRRVDLVYNRLTDFYFERPENRALGAAYLSGAAVVTPHPRAHALYADKRNLALLTDEAVLRELGVDQDTRAVLLSGIPRTEIVRRQNAEALWGRRKQLFFKPAAGYGGKAAYRGDKLTRRVFEEILEGDYVAQALVAPSQRRLEVGTEKVDLKLDIRNYVYAGRVQLLAARLYRGQTTNFRTPGGGFAPVLTIPCAQPVACPAVEKGGQAEGSAQEEIPFDSLLSKEDR